MRKVMKGVLSCRASVLRTYAHPDALFKPQLQHKSDSLSNMEIGPLIER